MRPILLIFEMAQRAIPLPKDGGPLRDLFRQGGLGRGETRNRDSEWTATNVVEPEPVTEFY